MYSLSCSSLPPLLTAVITLFVSLYVFFKNPRSKTHRALLYLCLNLAAWAFCSGASFASSSIESAEWWARFAFIGFAVIPSTSFYFYSVISGIKSRKWAAGFCLLSAAFILLQMTSSLIYREMGLFSWGYYPQAGPLHALFIGFCAGAWVLAVKLVSDRMKERKAASDFISYNQIKYVFFGLFGQGLGVVDFLPSYGIPTYPFGCLIAVYWCTIVTFAITRYKMLADISFLTRRVLIASAVIFQMASFYLLFLLLRRIFPMPSSVYIALVSTASGLLVLPMIRKTKNLIDKTFFPEFFERKEKLAHLGQQILLCKNPDDFNQIILDNIFTSFKITRSYLYIWNEEKKSYALQAATAWGAFVEKHETSELTPDHAIPKYLRTNPYLLYADMRGDASPTFDERALSLSMLELGVTLCVPVCSGGKLLGVFLFGDKESGLSYDKDDIKALGHLAGHAAVAIENINLSRRWTQEVMNSTRMDKILRTYMSSSVADEVLKRVDQVQHWKRERHHATILMCDLRGFTNLSERFSPEEMVRALNEYFGEMTETIMHHGGSVDKFMGDAILAVFGVPNPLPESEKAAVLCALEMQVCLKKLNRKRAEEGAFMLGMGVGIAAGDVIAGNIGSDKRMEFTVIGDAVNTASRLQSIAASGKILVTNRILDKVEGLVEYSKLPPVPLKGKSEPMDVIEILHLKDAVPDSDAADPSIINLPLFDRKAQ